MKKSDKEEQNELNEFVRQKMIDDTKYDIEYHTDKLKWAKEKLKIIKNSPKL